MYNLKFKTLHDLLHTYIIFIGVLLVSLKNNKIVHFKKCNRAIRSKPEIIIIVILLVVILGVITISLHSAQ